MSLEPTDPDQLVRDLQMTPRWIVMSLKEARQQAAEEKAVRERLEHESAGLRVSADDYVKRGQATEARLALLTSEFLEYVSSSEKKNYHKTQNINPFFFLLKKNLLLLLLMVDIQNKLKVGRPSSSKHLKTTQMN